MELSPKENVEAAIRKLREDGHTIQTQVHGNQGTQWFEIDGCMLLSWEEMQNLGTGVYSFDELKMEFMRRAVVNPSET